MTAREKISEVSDNIKKLEMIYSGLVTGVLTTKDASEIMMESWFKTLKNALINKGNINNLIPYTDEDKQLMYLIVNISQFIYNDSGFETGLTDTEYDIIYSIMINNGGDDIISVPLSVSVGIVDHHEYPFLRGTLDKVYYLSLDEDRTNSSRKYLDEWIASSEIKIKTKYGISVNLNDEEIYVFPKFDGVSGIMEFDEDGNLERVLTRGYTETNEAQNITMHFKNFKRKHNKLMRKKYGLKTEIMMKESDLDFYNTKYHCNYKNTRSIVSAIVNSNEYDPVKASLLIPVPLRVGYSDGSQEIAKEAFSDYPCIRCRLKDRDAIRKFAYSHKYVNDGLRCDGAVIYIINPDIQRMLGRENHKNKFEVAFKFTEETAFSTVKDIEFNMGLFGRLAPVAVIKPVKLKGNTIDHVSLGSIGRYKSLNLRKGDTVKILYDIIPYLVFDNECKHNYDNEIISYPDNCPDCGEPLTENESGDIISCTNPKCPCRQKGKILNYLNKMGIDSISYGTVNKLYDYGLLKEIPDLYTLKLHAKEIESIDGLGALSTETILNSIESISETPDYMVLGSIGIEGMGKKTFKKILSEYTIDELLDFAKSGRIGVLCKIPGIKEKNAVKIIEGLNENKKLIKKLKKHLVLVESKGKSDDCGFKVCFTKIRDKVLEDLIEKRGGEVVDNVTKDTYLLVVPSLETQSAKVEKARKYGVQVVDLNTARDIIKSKL